MSLQDSTLDPGTPPQDVTDPNELNQNLDSNVETDDDADNDQDENVGSQENQDPNATNQPKVETEAEKVARRMQRRIDRRTADLYRTRAQLEEAQRRLSAAPASPAPQAGPTGEPGNLPDPEEIRQHVVATAREIAQLERVTEACNKAYAEGKKLDPKFDDSLRNLAAETGPLFDQMGRPTPAMQVFMESDNPAKLLSYLGNNPDVAAELADLTPTQLARRVDRIERELTTKPTRSSAPPPLTPTKGTRASTDEPSDDDDVETWMAKEAKRVAGLRKAGLVR